MNRQLFSSEAVTSGHPDKIADQISDEILDRLLEVNPKTRVAIETFGSGDLIVVGGETSSELTEEEIDSIAVESIDKILRKLDMNEYADNVKVRLNIQKQSMEISESVSDDDKIIGAGDQGIMVGYATTETENNMPYAYHLARELMFQLEKVREEGILSYLKADGKTMVTIDKETNEIDNILISTQHNPTKEVNGEEILVTKDILTKDIATEVIVPVMKRENQVMNEDKTPKRWVTENKILINPAGVWTKGGMETDAGLTGRKIIFDTYGGSALHGGGAFSGKDASKVDRSGAYMARFLAKNILHFLTSSKIDVKEVTIQLSYGIGISEPLGMYIDINFPEKYTSKEKNELIEELESRIRKNVDLTPQGIIDRFGLQEPIYHLVSSGGHFGKSDLTWEQINESIFK